MLFINHNTYYIIFDKNIVMKKLIYLFLTILIIACGDSDDSSNYLNNGDYFFEVEFGGVINRVEGSNGNEPGAGLIEANQCFGNTSNVTLSITDITAENYVSGQNMSLQVFLIMHN